MWTKRRTIAVKDVPTLAASTPVLTTPAYTEQQCSASARADLTLSDEAFNFLSSLGYTLVPRLSRAEAQALLPWVMARWLSTPPTASDDKNDCNNNNNNNNNNNGSGSTRADAAAAAAVVQLLAADADVCEALSQVEYFFAGTDNGHLLAVPMVPTHFLSLVAQKHAGRVPRLVDGLARETAGGGPFTGCVPVNGCHKRVLHRHVGEEPVVALDHCGSLVASAASADAFVAVSCFHPRAVPIAMIPHGKTVRSLKLWEGGPFARRGATAAAETETGKRLARRWQDVLAAREPAAVYLFTGEELDAVVRLYRIDVVRGTFALLHVFVVSPNLTGIASPLAVLDREDTSKAPTLRETGCAIHCLAVDDDRRLLAGVEGGICVWALDTLPYTVLSEAAAGEAEAETPPLDPLSHGLCWDAERQRPLTGALLSTAEFMTSSLQRTATASQPLPEAAAADRSTAEAPAATVSTTRDSAWEAEECGAATRRVKWRATRLVNQHVWVRESAVLRRELALDLPPHLTRRKEKSKWRPKYSRAIAGGLAIGVVSNEVAVPVEPTATLAETLAHSIVTVSFDGGEVKNDAHLPLSCVQPVVYPLCWLRTPGTACFALQVLQASGRIVSSGSDGRVAVWYWEVKEDRPPTYLPYLVAGRPHDGQRGIGRHVCVMRSPDIFLSCGFDDGIVREWHVYDEPERLLRCERRFTSLPADGGSSAGTAASEQLKDLAKAMIGKGPEGSREGKHATTCAQKGTCSSTNSSNSSSSSSSESDDDDEGAGGNPFDGLSGISCAVSFPPFGAVFLVGVFEPTIQTFSLAEVQGCAAPEDYIYNGFKTVKLPPSPSPSMINL